MSLTTAAYAIPPDGAGPDDTPPQVALVLLHGRVVGALAYSAHITGVPYYRQGKSQIWEVAATREAAISRMAPGRLHETRVQWLNPLPRP